MTRWQHHRHHRTPSAGSRSFTYDALNRLTSATGPFGTSQAQATHNYSYDANGNILEKAGVTYSYSDAAHPSAVTSASDGKSYTYDASGNMLSDGSRTFTWDADNRLASLTQGGSTTTFIYDYTGTRVEKLSCPGFDGHLQKGHNTKFASTKIPGRELKIVEFLRGIRKPMKVGALLVLVFLLAGCVSYVTPGRGVVLSTLADADIQELLSRKPASPFPLRLALVRVQAPNYRSPTSEGYGQGRYTVVTTRDIEEEKDFERISRWPMVLAAAPVSRLLLPIELQTDKELRIAAAKLQADMVLVYTVDTTFRIGSTDIGPLSVITLGFLPNQQAQVTATASAVFFDVRTGFVYGSAESTARESQMATVWSTQSAIERSRLRAEAKAFDRLLHELDKTWKGILAQHSKGT